MRPRKGWIRVDAGIADDERTRDIAHKSRLPVISTCGWMIWLCGWIKTGGNPRNGTISFTMADGARKANFARSDQLRRFLAGAAETKWLEYAEADGKVHVRVVNYRKWQDPLRDPTAPPDHVPVVDAPSTLRRRSVDAQDTTRQQLDNNSTTQRSASVDADAGGDDHNCVELQESGGSECAANAQPMRRVFPTLRPLPDQTRQDKTKDPSGSPEVTESERTTSKKKQGNKERKGEKARARPKGDPRINEFKSWAAERYQEKFGSPMVFSHGRDGKLIKEMLGARLDLDQLQECWLDFLQQDDDFLEEAGHSIPTFRARLPRILERRRFSAGLAGSAPPRYPDLEDG